MKIQTFDQGELIDEREVEDFNISPNNSQFNTQMLFSNSYLKLSAGNKEMKARLELLAIRLELKPEITNGDLQIFQFIWNTLIDSMPEGILIEADRENLEQIAQSNNMPFSFEQDFKLNIFLDKFL